jgi:hypothetical protein
MDRDFTRLMDGLTAPGGMFALTVHHRFGRDLPMIAGAPSNLADFFAHFCAQHGDAPFIVDGGQRYSFAEVYAAARIAA